MLQRNSPLPPLGSVAEPWWDDRPLAIVGGGPSLKGFDFDRLRIPGIRVIAVNETIWDVPFADALFSLDRPYINKRAARFNALRMEKHFAVEPEYGPCAVIEGATYYLRSRFDGYSNDPSVIQSGGNSGFGATQLGFHKRGPRRHPWQWVLFGFDYLDHPDVHHNHERYVEMDPETWRNGARHNARYWQNWGDNFLGCRDQLLVKNIKVMNASPVTTVRAFDKCSVDEGVALLTQLAAQ
jgi:hypothetical protein